MRTVLLVPDREVAWERVWQSHHTPGRINRTDEWEFAWTSGNDV